MSTRIEALQAADQVHKFVTDQGGVNAEKCSQQDAGPKPLQKHRSGQENECKGTECGQQHLGDGKAGRAFFEHGRHERIGFVGTHINQLQCEKRIHRAHHHDSRGEEKEPRMVPVCIDGLDFAIPAGCMTARAGEAK